MPHESQVGFSVTPRLFLNTLARWENAVPLHVFNTKIDFLPTSVIYTSSTKLPSYKQEKMYL